MRDNNQPVQLSVNPVKPVRADRKTHNVVTRRKKFRFPSTAVARPAVSGLILPSIRSVAPKLVYQKSVESTSKIALAFLDTVACDEDAAYASTPLLFIERAFNRWVAERTASIKHLSPCFTITDNLDVLGEQGTSESKSMIVGITYSDREAVFCSLQTKIEALEKVAPGLGETAMSELYAWLCRTTFSISPDCVFSMVQQMYWHGGESEKEYIEEMLECGEEEDGMGIPVTLAAFEEDFPRYAYCPSSRITKPELELLASHSDPFVRSVVALLLAAPCQETWHRNSQIEYLGDMGSENTSTGYATVVNWNPDGSNITNRVCDDWMEDTYQVGSTDLFATIQCGQDREGAEKLFANLEQYISALTWVDDAIGLMTTVA